MTTLATPTRPMPVAPVPRRSSATPAAMVVTGIAALVVVVATARSATGMRIDQAALNAVGGTVTFRDHVAELLRRADVPLIALVTAILVGLAVLRGRLRVALAAAALVGGANITTQVIKQSFLQPLSGTSTDAMPSGHATIGISLGMALVLAAPVAWRLATVPLAVFVGVFFGVGTIAAHWHRPGDVLAAAAVCLSWAGIALWLAGPSNGVRRRAGAPLLTAALGAAAACAVFLRWGAGTTSGTDPAIGLLGVAAAIAAVVVVLAWLARAVRVR